MTESAEAVAATDEKPASSAEDEGHQFDDGATEEVEEQNLENDEGSEGDEPEPKVEDPEVILTENTQRRFDTLTGEIKTLREELEFERSKNSGTFDYDGDPPNPDDFDDDTEYTAALARHQTLQELSQRTSKRAQETARERQDRSLDQKLSIYDQRAQEFSKTVEGFQEKINASQLRTVDNGRLTPATEAILEMDNGPQVALMIANDPALALQLNNSSEQQAWVTVAQLSERLKTASPRVVKKAPEPIGSEDTGAGLAAKGDEYQFLSGATFE